MIIGTLFDWQIGAAAIEARGGHFAEDGDDVVLRDELADGVRRFFLLGLIVLGIDLDLASVDAAGGVDLVARHHDAVVSGLPEGCLRSGHRAVLAKGESQRSRRRCPYRWLPRWGDSQSEVTTY